MRALCSRVIVVYKGEIVEEGQTEDVLLHPKHEYTRHLVASIPEGEKGESSGGEILRLTDLNVFYDVRGGLFRKKGKKHVIHDLNLSAREGEIVGIVGESGCGKSTLSKTILGLHDNYTGEVKVRDGVRPQMVFQDPAGSLNPARTIGWILEEPLRLRGIRDRAERRQLVKEMLENVGLDESFAARHPRELSGGQKQRISIGVALLMDPRLVIADEPVSALDVTVQSQILNLLLKLHAEKQMTILFISHDLNVVRGLCGGSVPMRDAAIYVRENSWDDAYELWNQAFEGTKNQKKKMRAALNIAVYYEMKDSLAKAEEWAEKAQQLAKKIDKKNITDSVQASIDDVPNYYLTSLYLAELKERNAQLPKLKLQMSRFNDDF